MVIFATLIVIAVALVVLVIVAIGNYRRSERAEVKARERCLVRTGRCRHDSHYH